MKKFVDFEDLVDSLPGLSIKKQRILAEAVSALGVITGAIGCATVSNAFFPKKNAGIFYDLKKSTVMAIAACFITFPFTYFSFFWKQTLDKMEELEDVISTEDEE